MLVEYARRGEFVAALRRANYDLVVLGGGWNPAHPFQRSSPFSPTSVADQAVWLSSAGYQLVQHDEDYFVFRALHVSRGVSRG